MTKINLETAARAGFEAIMLRGGRLVKRKGQVISFAPHVGQLSSVSSGALAAGLALGASLLGGAPAFAGTCDPLLPPPGTAVTCTGAADLANDVTVVIDGEQVTVNTTPGFGVSTSLGDGLNISSVFNSNFVDTNAAAITSATGTALAVNSGGDAQITTNGVLLGETYGIKVATGQSVTLDLTGAVTGATKDGILVTESSTAIKPKGVIIRASTVTGGQNGIIVTENSANDIFIQSSNSVRATGGLGIYASSTGIFAVNGGRGENLIVETVDVTGKDGGIDVLNNGTGATSVSSTGFVASSKGNGIAAYNDDSATDITINANVVDAQNTGILARNLGIGNTTITSGSYVEASAGGDGIFGYNGINAGDLTITAVKVQAGDDGIVAYNAGRGATSVTATGDIAGTVSGISVLNAVNTVTYTSNTTDLTVKAVNVTGGLYGIIASNQGNGDTFIGSTGSVSANSATGTGISVLGGEDTTGLTIEANAVSGGANGVFASHNGGGNLSITTDGLVEGKGGFGIDAYNDSAASDLTILANGNVTALYTGINVFNNGGGNTSVTAFGSVEADSTGIGVFNGTAADDLVIEANVVSATDGIGISAFNNGAGSTSITATGAVTGYGSYGIGIYGYNAASAKDLTIEARGNVTGDTNGILVSNKGTNLTIDVSNVSGGSNGVFALNNGSEATLIKASGLVNGSGGDGIYAFNGTSASNIVIDIVDAVGDGENGVKALNTGIGGYTYVKSTGTVTGAYDGINAANRAGTTDLTIVANNVEGGVNGIFAENLGTGATIVTATGLVGGTAADGYTTADGISVTNSALGNTAIPAGQPVAPLIGMQVSAHAVNGGVNGIFADHNGAGGLVITADGTVNGRSADGIYANNSTVGTYLSVTTAAVTGGANGIIATNNGTGFASVTANGLVTGGAGKNGIEVRNAATATDITVNANIVTGDYSGIDAYNGGTGSTTITTTGDITGKTGVGIFADNGSRSANLTVIAVNVAGANYGIEANNKGNGTTIVSTTGLVGGTAIDGYTTADGISVTNSAIGNTVAPAGQTTAPLIGMQVSAHDVNGGVNGIFADHNGAGGLVITTDGAVNGRSADGIYATNSTVGTYLSVTTAAATGGVNGIFAQNLGTGATLVSAGGAVTGGTRDGIYADTEGTNLTISASAVTGGLNGIVARNDGSGFALVTASGAVTGSDEDGIYVFNFVGTTNLTISTNAVTGGRDGVFAENDGSGNTTITTNGVVTGTAGDGISSSSEAGSTLIVANALVTGGNYGINADSDFDGVNLTIAANAVTGGVTGIYAANFATGATLVTASGVVEGTTGFGINAQNGVYDQNVTGGTDLTIDVETDVKGGTSGIFAINNGSGVTLINTTGPNLLGGGTVTGYAGNGIDVLNGANASDLIIEAANVTGSLIGVRAINIGDGATLITGTGAITGNGSDGVFVSNADSATNLIIDIVGATGLFGDGIDAVNNGVGGYTSVTSTGTVTGAIAGISIVNEVGTTDLTIVANNVDGGENGIFATNEGIGATSITTNGLVNGGDYGIAAVNELPATDLTIVSNGDVSGGRAGIVANNNGIGNTSITANAEVTGDIFGIAAQNFVDAFDLEITANIVTATDNTGIITRNFGKGFTSVTATGDVTGGLYGIYATNDTTATNLTVNANNVTGGEDGIYAENNGSGATSVTASGDVVGTVGQGLDVVNGATATDLTINASNVTGGDDGIAAFNGGIGATSVAATGDVSGAFNDGIGVYNAVSSTNLTVVANNVAGISDGIDASNKGTGFTSVTATGNVTGEVENGVLAYGGEETTGLTVATNNVTGGQIGINAVNNGTGTTSVSATGDVSGTAADGIFVSNSATAKDLTIAANNITGGDDGIYAINLGTGVTSVTSTGIVSGVDNGIDVTNILAATGLTVAANSVTGGNNGIDVANNASGSTSVTSTGLVTGTAGNGIYAYNASTTANLSISANDVSGSDDGIFALNNGTGVTSVIATGAVTGTDGEGIDVSNSTTGSDLTVAANDVTGGQIGIYAVNSGTGATSISATGDVTGEDFRGIYATNGAGTTSLTIASNNVAGATSGIVAYNGGTGGTSVSSTGDVVGTTVDGIDVVNSASATNLTINATDVTGGETAILAFNGGSGSTSISSTGILTGTGGSGIDVINAATTADLTIIVNDVTGDDHAILASNNGTGKTSITSTGTVTGSALNGINAYNSASASDLRVSANDVIGATTGISIVNKGSGATSVSATGIVTGTGVDGINIRNSGTDLTVLVNDVTGGDDGIDVFNGGTGATSISATGAVTGADNGIEVINGPTGTDLTVVASSVTAGDNGIDAFNLGSGSTVITSTGPVTGGSKGISVFNAADTVNLTVNAGDVSGAAGGISAASFGNGVTSVTSTGTVEGTGTYGIYAYSSSEGSGLSVTANNVAGAVDGIYVTNYGTGDTVVTSTGDVVGTDGTGILARNLNADGGELRVTAKSVSGLSGAIVLQNDGTGASTVSVSGKIEGGDGAAIDTFTLDGNLTTINLANTAVVGAVSGSAIANNEGNSILNVAANSVISGTIVLGDGNDTANFARNGVLASVTLLDGGDDTASADASVDTLNLNGNDDFELVGANTVNWETINLNGGTTGFSDAAILAETININNRATLDGTNNLVATANINVSSGSTLEAGNASGTGAMRILGNLTNAGIVNLSSTETGARAGDRLRIGGNYVSSAGQVRLDTVLNGDNSPTDLLDVTGNVNGSSLLAINNVGGVGGLTTGDGIKVVQVGGTSDRDAFRLLDDELQAGAFRYDLFLGGVADPNDQDWYLRTVGLSDIATTTLSFARLSDDIAMTFLGTLHERVGEQERLAKRGYQSGGVSGLWGRFVGKGFREKLSSPTLGDVKSTGSITGLQMGLDFVRNIKSDGSATFAGAYSGYADGSSSDQNIFQGVPRRSGTSGSKGWLAGFYATHYASSGWYANTVVQANWVDASANTKNGIVMKTDGHTYLSSFELGQSLKLADRLAFETQAQLIYGDTQFDEATDSSGIVNKVGIESSLIGRVGFRLKTTKAEKFNAEGGLFSGYLKANLWHNLSGADVELISAGQAIGSFEPKKTWVDAGLGTTLTVSKNTELFFDADVEFGLDQKTTAGTGKVGLRINW